MTLQDQIRTAYLRGLRAAVSGSVKPADACHVKHGTVWREGYAAGLDAIDAASDMAAQYAAETLREIAA